MDTDAPSCRALNVSDERQCMEGATSVSGMFCSFHSRQCQGLYRGYKRRNEKLDQLEHNPPQYLKKSRFKLPNETFADVDSAEVCKELHAYLFQKFQLLDRVIQARRLHHSRFFSQDMDYGHSKFLDVLQDKKSATLLALERLERRRGEIMYKEKKWYSWVREQQEHEELTRSKEQIRVKQEASMLKRNLKRAEVRMKEMRAKEQRLRSDAYLEQIYKERLKEKLRNGELENEGSEDDDDEMEWDPIEDVCEENKGSYLDLIHTFLWMEKAPEPAASQEPDEPSIAEEVVLEESFELPKDDTGADPASKTKKKSKKKKKPASSAPVAEPDKDLIETRDQVYDRLRNGTDFQANIKGWLLAGSIENPVVSNKTTTFPEEQTQELLNEISQIKHLLFCRLLLGHTSLLPAALKAESVQEFLRLPEVTGAALRDLCLKMENPGLQDIRDACADFFREDDESDEDDIVPVDSTEDADFMSQFKSRKEPGALPDKWVSKRDKAKQEAEERRATTPHVPSINDMMGGFEGPLDFGDFKVEEKVQKKIQVTICGQTIWNYPSNRAMSRGGWLHFCIIAKDSNLNDVVSLCRHWDEFFEVNILACWNYFPGAKWTEWVGPKYRQQMLQLGFIVYFESAETDAATLHAQRNNNNRRMRRAVGSFEARNFMCAHIKRDDPSSRRFLQYIAMQSHRVLLLVRDAETGKIIIKPKESQLWLYRDKRIAHDKWNILKAIGPQFFEEMDKYREWNFSFKGYYDVYLWDLEPGQHFPAIYNLVQGTLFKALRFKSGRDFYNPSEHVLKSLTRDKESHRVRDIKPNTDVMSVWDDIHHEKTTFMYGQLAVQSGSRLAAPNMSEDFPHNLFYNETDVLEDEILFPEERTAGQINPLDIGKINPLNIWEESGYSMQKFCEQGFDSDYSLDTEDELDEDEDEEDELGSEEFEDEDEILGDIEDGDNDEDMDDDEDMIIQREDEGDMTTMFQKLNFSEELKDVFAQLDKTPREPLRDRNRHLNHEEMQEEFMRVLDQGKARVFKQVWHNADLDPHSQTRYIEMVEMARKSRRYNHRTFDCAPVILGFRLILDCDIKPEDGNRRDLHRAVAKLTPFFLPEFLESDAGAPFKDSLIFNQIERARQGRIGRAHHSNKEKPASFFQGVDDADIANGPESYPPEWDRTCRPIIAHLYKSGVLRTRPDDYSLGQAFAAKDPHTQNPDLFIDYRVAIPLMSPTRIMVDPNTVTPFKQTVSAFAAKHPHARFAMLSLWSGAHFYPLMIGHNKHDDTSFQDCLGRKFIWMFLPKDMPFSEWSRHYNSKNRIADFQGYLGDRVVVKRDKYLVMGEDEKDLFRLASFTTYAIEKRPWTSEVDLWKSFVNVDSKFFEELQDEWLE